MKIIKLTAENVKRLKLIEITPTGDVVQLSGKNGSGKTSVLDSIWWALGGEKNVQDIPIRTGADKARIRLDLGTIVVERKFSASGTTSLTVKNAEGAMYPSPQAMLDDLIGRLSFDPLAFAKKKPKEQYEEIKSIAKLSVDIEALEAANQTDFATRTERNRQHKELSARAAGFTFTLPPRDSAVDTNELTRKLQKAVEHNSGVDRSEEKRLELTKRIQIAKGHLEQMKTDHAPLVELMEKKLEAAILKLRADHRSAVKRLDDELGNKQGDIDVLAADLEMLPATQEKLDVDSIRQQLNEAEVANREFYRRGEQAVLLQQAKAAQDASATLTKAMEDRDAQKRAALQAAEMPVEGLSLSAGRVMFNGLPFEQGSDAEQLRVSVAIAMAANPKLRVIRIRDGSLLDDDGMAILREMAKEKDFQLWVEVVKSEDPLAIVMEDGSIKQPVLEETEA